jgi:voltage-gated potassium channel
MATHPGVVRRAKTRAAVSGKRGTFQFVARPRLEERVMSEFLRKPISVRSAANVIVLVTFAVVLLGGILMRVLDGDEYPNIWKGMWWALQTVTTIGYGDVTPMETSGRIVAVFIMLEGVAFLTIVIAAITSIFVARAQREGEIGRATKDESGMAAIQGRFDDLDARLDRLEATLSRPTGS